MGNIVGELIIILALILANGFFSGAEIAVLSLRKSRIQASLEAQRPGAGALATLRDNPERFIATVQIGITVVGTAAAAFGGANVASQLEPTIRRIDALAPYAREISLGLVVATIAYLSLVLGELVPKSLALRTADRVAFVLARPLVSLSYVVRPLVWLLTASSNLVLRPFKDQTRFGEGRISKEEVQQIVEEAGETGALGEETRELAARALAFEDLLASDVMVPRNRITLLPRNATHAQIKRCMLEERVSRIPIYDDVPDNVIGYVSAKDLVSLAWEKQLIVLEDVLRPVKIVGERTPVVELLQQMRREHQRIAVVFDEHGALAGLVTFEDIVEELVGEVFTERERGRNETNQPITHGVDGSFLIRGDVAIRDVNRELDLDLDEPEGVVTMSGLCIDLAGGAIPHRGARLAARDGSVLVVEAATARDVRKVRLYPPRDSCAPAVARADEAFRPS